MTKKGPTRRRPTPRTIPGIPGTVEPGYRERPIVEMAVPAAVFVQMRAMGVDTTALRQFEMGPCNIMVSHEPAGRGGALLWHLTISTPSRHPTWDEIKTARYRLLPHDITVAMLLPPPELWVNVPEHDHVMQLWEVLDSRATS